MNPSLELEYQQWLKEREDEDNGAIAGKKSSPTPRLPNSSAAIPEVDHQPDEKMEKVLVGIR